MSYSSYRVNFIRNLHSYILTFNNVVLYRIDREYYRQTHKEEVETKKKERNTAVLERKIPQEFDVGSFNLLNVNENEVVSRRDTLLAKRNPEKYCMERCVATGHCDVFEDLFDFTPDEVMEFCTDCVLSEEEEPCDVPEKFLMP